MYKKNIITVVVIMAVLGLFIYVQAEKHTTIGESINEQLGEEVEFLQLNVDVFDTDIDSHRSPRSIFGFTVGDEEFIQELLDTIAPIGIRRVDDYLERPKFRVVLSYQSEVRDNHYQNESLYMEFGEGKVMLNQIYEVKGDQDPVDVLEEMFKARGYEW